ncbi:PREDICTED: uncharacterized protein LOC109359869 [Lupinus angustifolius]|uniref:uncharacterized protein LOC109359869 n=1 Tax=Lupinus angustifolius TaxID=3871 RepID=UPI00092F25E1|nr:PREDICTED: uncharacterized protein LOC109359869 [Lupinus angustifolius]
MIKPIPGRILENLGPWYNENVTCDYHSGVAGHIVENYKAFKFKVQDLINVQQIDFREVTPNITGNPLPNHGDQGVNAIEEKDEVAIVTKVDYMKMPMGFIFRHMCKHGLIEVLIQETDDSDMKKCEMHDHVGHSLAEYEEFKLLLQRMMDLKLIAIRGKSPCHGFNVIERNPEEFLVFICEYEPMINPPRGAQTYFSRRREPKTNPVVVTNIAGNSRIIRSGRIYVPPWVERGPSGASKGKEETSDYVEEEVDVGLPDGVSNGEDCEFLMFIKQREYKAHVSHNISTDKLGGIVNNFMADNYISFYDQEIPSESAGHVHPIHISVMCNGCMIGKVVLDNESSLNIMTKKTFSRLPVDASHLRSSSMIIKSFYGSRRDIMGEMDLSIKIGSCIFNILFHVMNINSTYSFLLGRPWIQSPGVISSTLHQKVKFIVDGRLITVSREDVVVFLPFDTPYIYVTKEALETSFQGLQIANSTFVLEGAPLLKIYPSDVSLMMAKVMNREGYQPRIGLGRYEQGCEEIVKFKGNKDRYGLGYRPTHEDRI